MSNINQAGTYRGNILDRGLGTSSGGYPQLLMQLQATEKWDDQNEVWIPWEYEEVDATAYLVLFGSSGKPTLNVRQAMQALGWDGMSFLSLQEDKNLADKLQFRIAASTYEGVERLKVEWIATFDADPHRSVSKLDAADIRKLDAQYAAALKTLGGGPKPKTARPTTPVPVAPAPQVEKPVEKLVAAIMPAPATLTGAPAATASSPPVAEKPKRGRPPKPPAAVTPSVTPSVTLPAELMDQGTAWDKVYNAGNKANKTDLEITNAWVAVVNEAGGDDKVGEDWSGVAIKTVAALGV
jgi:hypothetical protein